MGKTDIKDREDSRGQECLLTPEAATHPPQVFSSTGFSPPLQPEKLLSEPFRVQYGVRSLEPIWNLPLTKFGEPTDPGQVRERFGFGQDLWFAKREILRILQVTE
jgi:hypothetical protein